MHTKPKVEQNGVSLRVDGDTIFVTVKGKEFYAKYPYDMTDVPEHLLKAMLYILFIGLIDMPTQTIERKGDKVLLSFSGGVDSYALNEAIDCIPVYLNRDYQPEYGKNQQEIVDAVGAIRINNDMELIRTMFDKKHGFNWGCGYSALLIPLMEKLNAGYIALGVVFDDACFHPKNGKIKYVYSELEGKSWYKTHYFNEVAKFGVEIIWPFIGASEAITTEIAHSGRYAELVSSCHFSNDKECGKCVKCLRKSSVDLTQMEKVLQSFWTRPKMAPTMIYSLKKHGACKDIDTDLVWDIHEHLTRAWNPDHVTKQILSLPYNVVDNDDKIKKFVNQFNAL